MHSTLTYTIKVCFALQILLTCSVVSANSACFSLFALEVQAKPPKESSFPLKSHENEVVADSMSPFILRQIAAQRIGNTLYIASIHGQQIVIRKQTSESGHPIAIPVEITNIGQSAATLPSVIRDGTYGEVTRRVDGEPLTIAEVPELPGVFAVGKRDGTVELIPFAKPQELTQAESRKQAQEYWRDQFDREIPEMDGLLFTVGMLARSIQKVADALPNLDRIIESEHTSLIEQPTATVVSDLQGRTRDNISPADNIAQRAIISMRIIDGGFALVGRSTSKHFSLIDLVTQDIVYLHIRIR